MFSKEKSTYCYVIYTGYFKLEGCNECIFPNTDVVHPFIYNDNNFLLRHQTLPCSSTSS